MSALISPTTPEQALAMLKELSGQLGKRLGDVQKWQDYYDGKHALKFATAEYQKHFGAQYGGFADNWCAPVADTTAEKLTLAGLRLAGGDGLEKSADRDFGRIWHMNEGAEQSSMGFTEACIARRTFALVWGDGDDGMTPDITFESPDEVIVGYHPGSRRHRKAALKQWTDGDKDFATLYTADSIWKWERTRAPSDLRLYVAGPQAAFEWRPRALTNGDPWVIDNPAGIVPIVEFANRPRLRSEPISEVAGAAAMQDAINAMWAYLFTSADFAALPQRVVLGAMTPKIPVLDSDGNPTGAMRDATPQEWLAPAAMSRLMAFEGPDAKIGSFPAANLEVFTHAIEFAVGHLAAQSRTPAHYFTGTINNVSADGLTGLAQAHIAKVRERAVYHGGAVREVAAVCYLMLGNPGKAAAARGGKAMWEDFEMRSEGQLGDLAIKLKQAGFSFEYIAQKFIADPVELAEELDRHNAEQAAMAAQAEFGPKPSAVPPTMADAPADA